MTYAEIAEKIEAADVEAFAWLLGLEFTHDGEPETAKEMIVEALRGAQALNDLGQLPPR